MRQAASPRVARIQVPVQIDGFILPASLNRNCETFLPINSTVPATSMPRTRMFGVRSPKPTMRSMYGRPVITCQSPMWRLAACTRTSTSLSPITGLSMSTNSRTSAEPLQMPLYTLWVDGTWGQIGYALVHCKLGDVLL